MATTVLVPLDGSAKDERAFPVALRFAHLADATLHVIRVLDSAAERAAVDGVETSRSDVIDTRRGLVERSVPEAVEELRRRAQRPVTWEVVDAPDAADALLDCAHRVNPVLIVMATRAPGPIGRAIHGSVADRLVRESAHPVILVPPGAEFLAGKQVTLRRMIVPLDGSPAAVAALDLLLSLPRANELQLVLLRVVSREPDHATAADAERQLEELAGRARACGAAADVRVVEADGPADVILGADRRELADVIAMSTRGAGGLERLILGSVATGVARKSEVPVLLVAVA